MDLPIQLIDVSKSFGATVALDRASFELRPGETLGFLGPNGAGKTTTLRLILGLLRPSGGQILVGGSPAGSAEARSRVAYVPGDVALWPRLTGVETLELFAALHGSDDKKYRDELIQRFSVDVDKRIRAYSKGNRQKIALIAAFASRAEVLLFDEPTSGLDPLMERVFRECVSVANERGQSVLLSSHLLSEVERLCHRIAMIRDGRIIKVADVDDLRERATTVFEVVGSVGDLSHVTGIEDVETTDDGVRITLRGTPGPLLSALGESNISSVRTREVSLEEIFLSFYDGVPT